MTKTKCPSCGKKFTRLGTHWGYNKSHRPEFTERQHEIITGLLMGDGTIYKKSPNHNPNFRVSLIALDYLKWLDDEFGCLSTGVSLKQTSEESAKSCKLSENNNSSDYHDVYRLITRSHPDLNKYHEWYDSGKKVFPENITLTPTVLTQWYISDGNWTRPYIRISMSNEINNKDKIEKMFEEIGFDVDRWDISERYDGSKRCCAVFNKEQAFDMFDYMDSGVKGFDYKFPEDPEDG